MFEKKLTPDFKQKLKTAVAAFSIVFAFGAAAEAQSVNDDLTPKKIESKPKVKVKTPAKSTTKKSAPPKSSARKTNSTRNNSPRSSEIKSFASETPDQIINRFMSFQQSAGVTDRDWKSVLTQTTKSLQNNPNNSVAKAQSLLAQGQIAYSERNYSMAAIHFKSVLQILPQSSLPHYGLGRTYLANGQAAAAERSFKEAIEQNENFALAYKGLGDALAAQGEKKKATKYFKKATEISVKEGNMPL